MNEPNVFSSAPGTASKRSFFNLIEWQNAKKNIDCEALSLKNLSYFSSDYVLISCSDLVGDRYSESSMISLCNLRSGFLMRRVLEEAQGAIDCSSSGFPEYSACSAGFSTGSSKRKISSTSAGFVELACLFSSKFMKTIWSAIFNVETSSFPTGEVVS